MPEITWDREKLERFKAALAKAKAHGQDVFLFEEHEFLQAYAKYLIEYLEGVIAPRED